MALRKKNVITLNSLLRYLSLGSIVLSAFFIGIALHADRASGSIGSLLVIGLILAAIAEWAASANKGFGCLIGVIWVVLIATIAKL